MAAARKKTQRRKTASRKTARESKAANRTRARTSRPRRAPSNAGGPTGDRVLQLGLQHDGEQYVLGARAPLPNSEWKGPWDCAEFASWCVFQVSGIVFGARPSDPPRADAYTGYWAEDARSKGAEIPIEEAARIPGAMLLRAPATDRTGHIAISDGVGGTIEAHSSSRGVCRAGIQGRRWDTGVLVPGIAHLKNEEIVEVEPPGLVLRVETPMIRGPRVRALQQELARRGHAVGKIDGVFGPQTAHAVQRFQADEGLNPDGEAGQETLAALGLSAA